MHQSVERVTDLGFEQYERISQEYHATGPENLTTDNGPSLPSCSVFENNLDAPPVDVEALERPHSRLLPIGLIV